MMILNLLAMKREQLESIVKPVLEICQFAVPILISIVVAVGGIYCVVLGVKYAKADDPQEHEKAKNGLKNAIIGFVLIFVLLIMLNIGMTVFTEYWQSSVN